MLVTDQMCIQRGGVSHTWHHVLWIYVVLWAVNPLGVLPPSTCFLPLISILILRSAPMGHASLQGENRKTFILKKELNYSFSYSSAHISQSMFTGIITWSCGWTHLDLNASNPSAPHWLNEQLCQETETHDAPLLASISAVWFIWSQVPPGNSDLL